MSDDAHLFLDVLSLAVTNEAGETWHVAMGLDTYAAFRDVIQKYGLSTATNLAITSLLMTRKDFPSNITSEEIDRIQRTLQVLDQNRDLFANKEEHLLGYSYYMLREKEWTRPRAAEIAKTILGRDISTDAWRMSVDRWAAKQGLPKVEQRRSSRRTE